MGSFHITPDALIAVSDRGIVVRVPLTDAALMALLRQVVAALDERRSAAQGDRAAP